MSVCRQPRITFETARFGWIVRILHPIDAILTAGQDRVAIFVALWRLGDNRHISAVLC
jgi:hypothetical protein